MDEKPEVECKTCGEAPLWWLCNEYSKWVLVDEAGDRHICPEIPGSADDFAILDE